MNVYSVDVNGVGLVDQEAAEFGAALERYKRANHRPYPTFTEVLAVLVSLGYRKVCPRIDPPCFVKGVRPPAAASLREDLGCWASS